MNVYQYRNTYACFLWFEGGTWDLIVLVLHLAFLFTFQNMFFYSLLVPSIFSDFEVLNVIIMHVNAPICRLVLISYRQCP